LLIAFQEKKIHLAIVIDEYGGTSGIVTMEDVLEEIIGDLRNEFDDERLEYSKLDESTYVLEGKIQLKDLYRILSIEGDGFDEQKGDSDTIAGFILEQKGDFPFEGERIAFNNYVFTVEAMDKKRIKRVKLEIEP
jgi:putative hemolysin